MVKRKAGQPALQERLSRSFSRIPAQDTPRIFRLRLAEIAANPDQPRSHIDQEGLRELAASIERHGLIQPITVRHREGPQEGYVLVAGERRLRAHRLLGRDEILAIVTAGAAEEISLIENVQREDLHPLEEAAAYARMMQAHGWTQEQLAEAVGKARSTITNILKLNNLAEPIKAECRGRAEVSKSLLFEIARQNDEAAQEQLWARVRAGGTVRSARAAAARDQEGGSGERPAAQPPGALAGLARSGQQFLKRLAAVEDGDLGAPLRKEVRLLRRNVESLLGKLPSDA